MTLKNYLIAVVIVQLFMAAMAAFASDEATVSEIRLNFRTLVNKSTSKPLEAQPPPANRVTVLEKRRVPGSLPRQRNPELSSSHLVVIGMDALKQEVVQVIVNDPRLIRLETTTSTGKLTPSEIIYQSEVEFSIALPDDPRIRNIRLYHPIWTGSEYNLELVGEAQLP